MYGIILAGGSGSRLWPMSRELYPKQLLKLDGDLSLLQSTFKRLHSFIKAEDIISITNIKHANDVKFQLSQIDKNSVVLAEPMAKNTAPAIAAALEYLKQLKNPEEVVLIVPSDPLIKDVKAFENTVKQGLEAAQNGKIVTFGIQPTYPETGYGYIKTNGEVFGINKVEKFVEKPDYETAEKYLKEGNYFWNGGIFMAKVSVLLGEIQKYVPEIYDNLAKLNYKSEKTIKYGVFENMPSVSIDYAVMEKTLKGRVVKLNAGWDDVGSWSALYDISKKDENQNVIKGDDVITLDTTSSYIRGGKRTIATIGLDDVVIVDSDDALLVAAKGKIQDVKNVAETIKAR